MIRLMLSAFHSIILGSVQLNVESDYFTQCRFLKRCSVMPHMSRSSMQSVYIVMPSQVVKVSGAEVCCNLASSGEPPPPA